MDKRDTNGGSFSKYTGGDGFHDDLLVPEKLDSTSTLKWLKTSEHGIVGNDKNLDSNKWWAHPIKKAGDDVW